MSTDQNGTMARTTAAKPLATCCWAQTTPPLPMTIINEPVRAMGPQVRIGGMRSPNNGTSVASSAPAAAQRRPASSATGTDSSATPMPR